MRTLYVAAGGGGDAVGALLARRALGDTDERPPLVTTCAWERLRIDPVPGPRSRADFTGLGLVGGELCEVLPSSDTAPSGRSVLPRLAKTSSARVFLHDFEGGEVSLRQRLQRLSSALEVDRLVVVDVGGDIVARGPEPDLRSPLADSLTLAAALATDIPTSVVVMGPGADAELPEGQVLGILASIGAEAVGRITPNDVRTLASVLSWHPTEATALVADAAIGIRGSVAMRSGRFPVPLSEGTRTVWMDRTPSLTDYPLAQFLIETSNFPEVEEVMRSESVNEVDFEKRIAQGLTVKAAGSVRELAANMVAIGATHATKRRVIEAARPHGGDLRRSSLRQEGLLWSLDEIQALAKTAR